MRKDIRVEKLMEGGAKINKSALARQYNCCWKTIDRRLNPDKYKTLKKKREYTSILDDLKPIIDKVLNETNAPATGIFYMLKERYDYKGSYSTVKRCVSKVRKSIIENLTIRFNTIPGYQAQVDWKETMTLYSTNDEKYTFNIFLILLGCSRMKYIELTEDRSQLTLFKCLTNAFIYFKGRPSEIIFDNMKTVVDRAKSDYTKVVINEKMNAFSKDAGFSIYTCKPYRPKTKGKIETLAKVMDRLLAFNHNFEDWDDLKNIVDGILYNLNYVEISQATNHIPIIDFDIEKEYLIPVNIDLLEQYTIPKKFYKVTKESMIKYKGKKYSVPTQYVGKSLQLSEDDEFICIYFNTKCIRKYNQNTADDFNYKINDYVDILKHSGLSEQTQQKLLDNINNDLKSLNGIKIEEEE